MFGYTREEMRGRVALDMIVPLSVRDQVQEVVRRVRTGDVDARRQRGPHRQHGHKGCPVEFFTRLLDTSDFPPRWRCGAWSPGHGWLHILSDLGVWAAYLAIPCVLGYFILRKKDVPFRAIVWLFAAFILACGTTHLMEAVLFWWPAYRLAGLLKLLTAVVSWATVLALIPSVPRALAMRSPGELEREIAERKRAEEALRESEERFRVALKCSPVVVFHQDRDLRYSWVYNPQLRRSEADCLGKTDDELLPPEDSGPLGEIKRRVLETGVGERQVVVIHDRGKCVHYDLTVEPLRDSAGAVVGITCAAMDVTESKALQTERDLALERLRLQIERLPLAHIVFDRDQRVLDWSPAAEKMFGYIREEMLGRVALDVFVPLSARDRVEGIIRHIRAGDMEAHSVNENRTKDGRILTCEWFNTPLFEADGRFAGVISLARDVTEQKRAEERLRRSEALSKEAEGLAHLGSWELLIPSNNLYWSEESYRIFGLAPEELPADYAAFLKRIHPLDRERVKAVIDRSLQDRSPLDYSCRIVRPDGAVRIIHTRAQVGVDGHGSPIRLSGACHDVTELRRTEEALAESERCFRAVIESALEPILLIDDNGRFVYGNPAACQLLGHSADELLESTLQDVTPALNRERVPELLANLLSAGGQSGEHTLLCKAGAPREVEYRAVANILPGVHLGVLRDITERKQAERAMQESHAFLSAVLEGIPDAVYVKDLQGRYLLINAPGASLIGKEVLEVLGRDDTALVEPETARRFREGDRRVMESGLAETYEVAGTAAGVTRIYHTKKAPFRGPRGELLGVLGISWDVTDKKRAEEEIRREKERVAVQLAELEHIYRYAPVGLCFLDRDFRYVRINEQLAAMNGRPVAEHIGRTFQEIIPEMADGLKPLFERMIASGRPLLNVELHGVSAAEPGGARAWLASYSPLESEKGKVVGLTAGVVDITDRKRAEEKAREYAERVQALSRRLLTVQEEERRHLARELHDEIGQSLTGLRFVLEDGPEVSMEEARDKLHHARGMVDELLGRVRDLSFDLRPAVLDHLGLLSALLWLFERFTAQTKVQVNFRHEGLSARFAPTIETAAFRVVQEGLTNIARHAAVGEAVVRAWAWSGMLNLQVEDAGGGFDAEAALASGATAGLTGMRERVELLGGQIAIDSAPGEGTLLVVRLPLGP